MPGKLTITAMSVILGCGAAGIAGQMRGGDGNVYAVTGDGVSRIEVATAAQSVRGSKRLWHREDGASPAKPVSAAVYSTS